MTGGLPRVSGEARRRKGGRKQGRGAGGLSTPGARRPGIPSGHRGFPSAWAGAGHESEAHFTREGEGRGRAWGEEGREGERKGSIPSPLVPSHRALGSRPLGLGPRVVSSGRALRGRRLRVRVRERGLVPKRGALRRPLPSTVPACSLLSAPASRFSSCSCSCFPGPTQSF